jgi:3-dehydroquinate synthase
VLIDPDLLKTLPQRRISNGLAESVKMALTCDKELFELIESGVCDDNLQDIIIKSITIKKNIVEQDEKESSLRRVLNFGHTVGHGIETAMSLTLLHGECVALGMIPMCDAGVRERLVPVLEALSLPTTAEFDKENVIEAIRHDKKLSGEFINAVWVNDIGSYEFIKIPMADFENRLREVL